MAEGVTIELLSLGEFGSAHAGDDEAVSSPGVIHDTPILDRVTVSERQEKRELVEAVARAIREAVEVPADRDFGSRGSGIAVILSGGGQKVELEFWPQGYIGYAHGDGVDDPYDCDDNPRETRVVIHSKSRDTFDTLLDRFGVKRMKKEK
ncbi:hypothetical protein WKV53_14875 [Luteolibacter sp. Y139]|uniref:Uncharacterized protein n=2 Tax=Luteolibacter soli TaxID=3135280 RepID=A0ABU9AXU3_9BACT